MTQIKESVVGLILAGGQGRRMQHPDKALVVFRGRPLLTHVLDRLRPQVDQIWLNVNRNQPRYEAFDLPLLSDHARYINSGPLAGIQAGLSFRETHKPGWLLVCPCDTPFLPETLADRLLSAALGSGQRAAVVHDGHRLHPVICLLHSNLLGELEAHLQCGPGSVHAWLEVIAATIVDFSDAPKESFANINTPEELLAFPT